MSDEAYIGVIARLQVQRASLKVECDGRERYEPAGLVVVPALRLDADGVTGLGADGTAIADVHHRTHPATKNRRGCNGISIGASAHYDAMRARFGPHLVDGIAGENILVATARVLAAEDLRAGLVVRAPDGPCLHLGEILVAEPCVPFTRYALRYPPEARSTRAVSEALQFLRGGMRGFYASYAAEPATIRLGDRVYLR